MAANRPNLGLQIALIIFVLLTITCGVGWVVYFNKTQDALAATKAAQEGAAASDKAKAAAEQELGEVMFVFGRGKQEKSAPVLEEFRRDSALHSVTFPEAAQTYPLMLKSAADAYLALLAQLADKDKTIASLQSEVSSLPSQLAASAAEHKKTYEAKIAEQGADRTLFDGERKTFVTEKEELQKQIEAKNAAVKDALDKKDKIINEKNVVIKDITEVKEKAIKEAEPFKKVDYKTADGIVVRVSQRDHTVWINRGQADGIKPQMIFSVFDRTAGNLASETVKPKGAIEVIRVLDAHTSEATITEDSLKDPIMKEDKIMNPAYIPGKLEHFAVAGFIDIDGDGQSDMSRLQTLIINNGGIVDAIIDDAGKPTGSITPATKLLVLGERPTEKETDAVRKAWANMLKDASDNKVSTMPLSEFIRYMGYQGSERSIPLGKGATEVPGGAPFKKRPARGADGGSF